MTEVTQPTRILLWLKRRRIKTNNGGPGKLLDLRYSRSKLKRSTGHTQFVNGGSLSCLRSSATLRGGKSPLLTVGHAANWFGADRQLNTRSAGSSSP